MAPSQPRAHCYTRVQQQAKGLSLGNIAIAKSDAGAAAYTHAAIDQAWRAVNELAA